MSDYDISQAFKAIENELIDSMMRNFSRHRAEELKEGYNWAQWQAEQLKSLEQYRKRNIKKFNKQFFDINDKISEMLKTARADGNASQEAKILMAIKNGFNGPGKPSASSTAEFFKVNDRKLNALIKATTDDLKKAETAILRMSNDKYRKAIFNAQVYANSGAGTYEKAVDMACRDMLRTGLNCVEYSNGARHTLPDYADMAIRTANKRAYLYGEGEKRAEWGISTVVVNQRQGGCPDCAQYIGQVFIDDVYSNGKKSDGNYPLLSTAIAGGLFHPRCKDSTSTYYEGITTLKKVSQSEISEMKENEVLEQQKNNAENQAEKCNRISKYSLDSDNKRIYQNRAEVWQGKVEKTVEKLNKTVENSVESEFISDDWKGLKYPQRKKRSDFVTDDEWQAFRKSYIEDFNKYNDDVDRIIKNHDSNVENVTEKKFIKWAEERGIENVNIKGVSKTAMADFMSSYDSMIEKLPKAAGKLKSVDIVSTKGNFSINQKALAWSDNDTSIHFAKSHFSKDKYSDVLQQEILSCVTGLNPDGANPYLHTYQHEMGHLIEKWIGKEAGGVDKLKEEMFKIFEGNLPDISDYGNNHGYGEWFAEMTSSYLNGTKSEKVEKFGGVLKKYFGSPDIAKSAESGIINTGSVSGALNPYSKEAGKHAVQYYESVRHMSTDTTKISTATRIKKDKIDKIKNHIFIQEHDLLDGHKRFDPSYDMAQSWQRLINGSHEEKDMVLLKHEYAELRYMEKGMTQNEAHIKASKRYNYAKYCE